MTTREETSGAFHEARVRTELRELATENSTNDLYRDYYAGDQKINFGTEKFQDRFGSSFEGFRDNWCSVVVDAVEEKIELRGLQIGRRPEEIEELKELSKDIWRVFLDNEIDEEQSSLHQGAFVEGRSTAIVWPDEEKGAAIHWNPAQLVRVRYDDETRQPLWAVKRWQDPTGAVFVTVYEPDFVYKYIDTYGGSPAQRSDPQRTQYDRVPNSGSNGGLEPRRVEGEPWPLPNPFGRVPVVPLQNAINYVLMQQFVAGEFQAFRQRVAMTNQNEPSGGWHNDPGTVWVFDPMIDSDGKFILPRIESFDAADPSTYIKIVEMYLQHVAFQTKTPLRYFFQSDRGGRGDAPSGESLKVEDKPLIDKARKRTISYGNSWYKVARLVADAKVIVEGTGPRGADLPSGEVIWRDQRVEYRGAAIAEAKAMFDVGLPRKFVWKTLGLTPEELEEAEELYEEEKEEKREEQEREQERELMRIEQESPDGISRPPAPTRSGPRPSGT